MKTRIDYRYVSQAARNDGILNNSAHVIPTKPNGEDHRTGASTAKLLIQRLRATKRLWIPAFAGMTAKKRSLHCAALMLLATFAAPLSAQSDLQMPSGAAVHQQRDAVAKSERIMAEAQKRPGLLSQYLYMRDAYANNNDWPFRVIFNQYLSWYQTWVGDYPGARTNFSIAQPAAKDDAPSPLQDAKFKPEPAFEAIAKLAKGRQAVFFNENHSYPLTRTLTVQMLATLRAEGFDTFAAETLYDTDIDNLQKRGYPISETGFYTEEPIYAEMVREALRLGYRIVAYEALSDATGDARETEQARNLQRDVFKQNPKARLVLNAGYAHIQEAGKYLGGASMAQHFRRITGIDPLTIEQTMLVPHEKASSDHPYYLAVMQALKPAQPIVFRDSGGTGWSLKQGAYDVSVFFPPESLRRGRPTWLDIGGLRQPYQVSGALCNNEYPCMVEARYEVEPDEAIPADRVVIEWVGRHTIASDRVRESSDNVPLTDLYLKPGRYRVVARDASNQKRQRLTITVRATGDKP
jgi:hypothetical protein